MRITLFFLSVAVSTFVWAQSDDMMFEIFPENFEGYVVHAEFESRILNDGTTRVTGRFKSENRELKLQLSRSSEENLDKNLADIGKLFNSLSELGEAGVMTVEMYQGKFYSGIFTFISRQQNVGGGLFLVRDRYLLEIEIIGGGDIEAARAVFDQLDLSKLN